MDSVDDTEVSDTKISLILMRFINEELFFNIEYLFKVTCWVNSPSNALVGKYRCQIYLESGEESFLDPEPNIILLFNPWNEEDETFMENEEGNSV